MPSEVPRPTPANSDQPTMPPIRGRRGEAPKQPIKSPEDTSKSAEHLLAELDNNPDSVAERERTHALDNNLRPTPLPDLRMHSEAPPDFESGKKTYNAWVEKMTTKGSSSTFPPPPPEEESP